MKQKKKKEQKDLGPRWPAGVDRQREGGRAGAPIGRGGDRSEGRWKSTPQSETGARTIEST